MRYINPRRKRTRQNLADSQIEFVLEHGYEKRGVNARCRYANVAVKLVVESTYQMLRQFVKHTSGYTPDRVTTFFLDITIQPEAANTIELREVSALTPAPVLENDAHQLTTYTI